MRKKNNYWLVKTEPDVYSIDHLLNDKSVEWDGVRNFEARNNLKLMQVGDLVFIYHSNTKNLGIAGLAEVTKAFYPDKSAFDKNSEYYDETATFENAKWVVVKLSFKEKYNTILTLHDLKNIDELKDFRLIKKGCRLSVMPVEFCEAETILKNVKKE